MNKLNLFICLLTLVTISCGNHTGHSEAELSSSVGPDISLSQITISSPNIADGVTPTEIKLHLMNAKGKAVVGLKPLLTASGHHNVIVPCTVSDDQGYSVCKLYSSSAEHKSVKLWAGFEKTWDLEFFEPVISQFYGEIVASSIKTELNSGDMAMLSSGHITDLPDIQDSTHNSLLQTSLIGIYEKGL